ncbi:MAG: DUF5333 domain-containing protein [Pseudomonadota bacterium]
MTPGSLTRRLTALFLALCLALPANAAQSGLRQEADINNALLVISVADKIRRACDSIGANLFKARSLVNNVKELALERGYSEGEIDSYINDKANRAEMRGLRNDYFEAKGASNLDAQSLCVLGRSEIASSTQIGRLLRLR